MAEVKKFGELFSDFRLRAGFKTLSEFGGALAEEGYVYEDRVFYRWTLGDRVPKNRAVVVALVTMFIKRKAINQIDDANILLESLDFRGLSDDEVGTISKKLFLQSLPFSTYKPLVEPSHMYQDVRPAISKNTLLMLDSLPSHLRQYWRYQADCAVAGYFSLSTGGRRSPEEVFKVIKDDEYDRVGMTTYIVGIATDIESGQEYLSGCDRITIGSSQLEHPINLMKYVGIRGGWRNELKTLYFSQIGELDRYVIPNWAWEYRFDITRVGYSCLVEYARKQGVNMLYALLSYMMKDMCINATLPIQEVKEAKPVAYDRSRDGLYLSTFSYGESFNRDWGKEYFLYRFLV